MTSSVNKFKNFADQIKLTDIIYDLSSSFCGDKTINIGTTASNNSRLDMWLKSEKGDNVNKPYEGGVVKSLIGNLLNEDNLTSYENKIKDSLQRYFGGEMSILSVKLTPQKPLRKVILNIITIDNVTGKVDKLTSIIE